MKCFILEVWSREGLMHQDKVVYLYKKHTMSLASQEVLQPMNYKTIKI